MIEIEDLCDAEWADWYRMTPQQRWAETEKLWATYLALGGTLDPEPDTQSPFFDAEESLRDLRRHRDAILSLAARHGASNVRVFGSVARGEAAPDSDVDLLVEIATDRSLFDQVALIQDLGNLLHRRVDVVSDRGLNARVRRHVLDEAVPL